MWLRTNHDGQRWYWRTATEAERIQARICGMAVHLLFGAQPHLSGLRLWGKK